MQWKELTRQTLEAALYLFDIDHPKEGDIMVVGCSTSEVMGQHIGSASSEDAARAIMEGLLDAITGTGAYLAFQGCEHINRALCVERECMQRYGLQEVWVKPWLHAGGALVTEATRRFEDPVMVESLLAKAAYGMDIGGTIIGMHLKAVAVPVHCDMPGIGQATLLLARTRPKYIGGPRAQYDAVEHPHK